MKPIPPLYILRHGETEWNVQGRLQGKFESTLTQKGIAQAEAQRAILAARDMSGFKALCSPQGRAQTTAQIALDGIVSPIATEPDLREIGLGLWAGKYRTDVMANSAARDGFDIYELAPDGEGFAALHRRCEKLLKTLETPCVLITHGITSRMLRLIVQGRPMDDLRDIQGGQGVVFYLADGQQTRLTKDI
ncbi:MAG: histidine phosphatase family protein [Sulfitobacter sp.]